MHRCRRAKFWIIIFVVCTVFPNSAFSYSVLTHEELIDLAWNDSIRPLLLARFPNATEAQLREAHAYAYGGSAIQDMGYYPFGKQLFSDLTHYVRSGDFVAYLFRDAQNIDEYAFAIGALSHYVGDSTGHSIAVNPSTAIEFPKLDASTATASLMTKVRTATSAPSSPSISTSWPIMNSRRKLISEPSVSECRARPSNAPSSTPTASTRTKFSDASISPFAATASRCAPSSRPLPKPSWSFIAINFPCNRPTTTTPSFPSVSPAPTMIATGSMPSKRGVGAHLLAVFVFIVPKVGPASDLAIKIPTPETEEWYLKSVNHSVDVYRGLLSKIKTGTDFRLALANLDLDTGKVTRPGTYPLTDKTYAQLLARLTSNPERIVPPRLKKNILDYYSDPNAPIVTKKNKKAWQRVTAELQILNEMKVGAPEDWLSPNDNNSSAKATASDE